MTRNSIPGKDKKDQVMEVFIRLRNVTIVC
jgi:hypothetical protein